MSILLPRNKSDHIYFIILFYYQVFKSLFNRSISRFYSTYIYYNNRSSCVNYVLIILMLKATDQPAHMRSLIRALASRLMLSKSEQSQEMRMGMGNENGLLLLAVPLNRRNPNSNRPSSAFVVTYSLLLLACALVLKRTVSSRRFF